MIEKYFKDTSLNIHNLNIHETISVDDFRMFKYGNLECLKVWRNKGRGRITPNGVGMSDGFELSLLEGKIYFTDFKFCARKDTSLEEAMDLGGVIGGPFDFIEDALAYVKLFGIPKRGGEK